jgi:hypothetical protein
MTTSSHLHAVGGPADVGHTSQAWLCLLPAAARRFRVSDPLLRTAVQTAGGELVERSPDVEIGRPDELAGDAGVAVVPIGSPGWSRGPVAARVAKRSLSSARARLEARRAGARLRALGYRDTEVATWDLGHGFRFAGSSRPAQRASRVELMPQCALAFGRRGETGESLLEAALRDAGAAIGEPLRADRVNARGGVALAFTDRGLLRVSVGPGRTQIGAQSAALRALRAHDPPEAVARRVPWQAAEGRSGLAVWSFERLLPGAAPHGDLSPRLRQDCLDFLVTLQALDGHRPSVATLAAAADVVARVCEPARAATVRDTGRMLDAALAEVPRGFCHGDFSSGNLLVRGDELLGVIDWDSAGPGRLALLDAIHLAFISRRRPADLEWGPRLVSDLIPWARAGGGEFTGEYCRRVGLDADPRLLELLVMAYWLDRTASQLCTHAERWDDHDWIRASIALVADAIGARPSNGRSHPLKIPS